MELPLFFSSNPDQGAKPRGNLGNEFDVRLASPITLLNSAENITIELANINIWFTTPNISESRGNNHIYITYDGKEYDIKVPDGSYESDSLNREIQTQLKKALSLDNKAVSNINSVFLLEPNTAVNRVEITLGDKTSCDFTPAKANNIGPTLGFDEVITGSIHQERFRGESTPRFNVISSYLLETDFVGSGVSLNSHSGFILGKVPLTAPPGHLISYERVNPFRVDASSLKISSKQNIHFRLTNEAGENIDMGGEYFDFALVIRWTQRQALTQMQGVTTSQGVRM